MQHMVSLTFHQLMQVFVGLTFPLIVVVMIGARMYNRRPVQWKTVNLILLMSVVPGIVLLAMRGVLPSVGLGSLLGVVLGFALATQLMDL